LAFFWSVFEPPLSSPTTLSAQFHGGINECGTYEYEKAAQRPAGSSRAPQEAKAAPLEDSKQSAAQPEVQQEPKPLQAENPTPPAQTPRTAEIDQQAVALWKQKRYSDAIPLFNQACSEGKMKSCYYLGLMYDFGQGVTQDYSRASAFYSKSCNAGNGSVCYHLGMLRDYQPGGMICNSPAVTLTASRSCNAGNAMICTMLGYSYSYGCGVAKDIDKGRQLLSKGCSLGYERACDGIK
jgi:TPR repeat protein